jgi:hypothetical protein
MNTYSQQTNNIREEITVRIVITKELDIVLIFLGYFLFLTYPINPMMDWLTDC